jgi:hypothetical protein
LELTKALDVSKQAAIDPIFSGEDEEYLAQQSAEALESERDDDPGKSEPHEQEVVAYALGRAEVDERQRECYFHRKTVFEKLH